MTKHRRRNCLWCRLVMYLAPGEFLLRRDAKYCSDKCRMAAARARKHYTWRGRRIDPGDPDEYQFYYQVRRLRRSRRRPSKVEQRREEQARAILRGVGLLQSVHNP
jgi:hypothetical protein